MIKGLSDFFHLHSRSALYESVYTFWKDKSMPRCTFTSSGFSSKANLHLRLTWAPSWSNEEKLRVRWLPLTHLQRRRAIKSGSKGVNRGEPIAFPNASCSPIPKGDKLEREEAREREGSKELRWFVRERTDSRSSYRVPQGLSRHGQSAGGFANYNWLTGWIQHESRIFLIVLLLRKQKDR